MKCLIPACESPVAFRVTMVPGETIVLCDQHVANLREVKSGLEAIWGVTMPTPTFEALPKLEDR